LQEISYKMTIVFDGKKFASEKEKILKEKISSLKRKPKLVSILVGSDPASILYTNLKQKAADRVGAEFLIIKLQNSAKPEEIIRLIDSLNKDRTVDGIMVQLPLPEEIRDYKLPIINSIDSDKDVDGLGENSKFTPATVRAVLSILAFAKARGTIALVGAKGMVGKPLLKKLIKLEYKVLPLDKDDHLDKVRDADIVISATGVSSLIKASMVKDSVIVIDVGSPRGDFDPEVSQKADFFTPVPGGVGPVTIVSLLENLVEA